LKIIILILNLYFSWFCLANLCKPECHIEENQKLCIPDSKNIESALGGQIQYKGKVLLNNEFDFKSPLNCGTLDERQNCKNGWGIKKMNTQYPQFSFKVEKQKNKAFTVKVYYSWLGRNSEGNTVPNFNIFTAILSEVKIRIGDAKDPDRALVVRSIDLKKTPLNFGGYLTCPAVGAFYEFIFRDIYAEISDYQEPYLEINSIGNFE